MNINNKKLAGLKSKYNGYISGEKIDKFFNEFGIKFAAATGVQGILQTGSHR